MGDDVLEIGPGPGVTTDLLRGRTQRLTVLEVDATAAAALQKRLNNSGVRVVHGDGAAMPFADGSFSGVVSLTMLHHVPTPALQDRLLAEARRVLRPGAVFAGLRWCRLLPLARYSTSATLTRRSTRTLSRGGWRRRALPRWPSSEAAAVPLSRNAAGPFWNIISRRTGRCTDVGLAAPIGNSGAVEGPQSVS